MRINQNVAALNAWRHLTTSDAALSKSLERLSSGLRINRAADDAAGLAISEKMRAQVRGIQTAQRNALDGISLIQTAEGALNEGHAILQRMRELAVQSATGTLTEADRDQLQLEVGQLIEELDRIAESTQFNELELLDGSFAVDALAFHVGPNSGQTIEVNIADMTASGLAVDTVNIGDTTAIPPGDPDAAIIALDTAIDTVSSSRAELGAIQNRLEHTIASLGMAAENLQAAESRIRDVDMAMEMTTFTRNQILLQSGTAMLAHANMKPQAVLQLLG